MSVVLADAIAELLPSADIRLKWPNDVLLSGGKVAGLLPEAVIEGGDLKALLLGIGVNVAHKPDLPDRATSRLADFGTGAFELDDVLGCILRALDQWFSIWLSPDGFSNVKNAWRALGPGIGSPVSVKLGEERIDGAFRGLAEDGALVILEADGNERRILAGEVLG
jgi:BirA family biotin operon repressor/biotin-[acetyl-CoA-carboxylase] ligase